ncbi:MAG TPA: PEP-CTERM sorting domain-containing protein, partial [Lacunisphaera sp.]|nr:PEP-CTERM sorting domain-containing protein [Lacunisphaera sp.]
TYNYDNNHGFLDATSIHAGTLHLDGGSINHTGLGDIQVSLGPGDTGNLVIDNGGHATDYFGVLAQGSGSTATAIVSGAGSFWDHSSGMDIGHSGVGTLNILNDGDVTITGPWAFLGWTSSGNGTVNLDGMGSTWSIGGEVLVGGSGTGTITVGNHAALHVNAGASNLILGSSTMSSTGTLNIGAALGDTAAAGGLINAAAITTGSGTGTLQFKTIASSASPYYLTRDGTTGGPAVAVSGAVQVINTAGYNVLTGANAYTGGTAITGGTLVAGNDLALGLGAVVLNGGTLSVASGITFSNTLTIGASGGRLSGNGSFSSPLTLGAGVTLAPGTSPGTLHFLSGLALNDGGALEIELQAPGGTPGSNWDLVNITGTLNLGNLTAGGYSLRAISLALDGNPGAVDGLTGPASWVIATASGGITGFEAGDFLIDFSQFTGGGDFSLTLSGNDLLLNFAPVPEPTTYALLATGLVLAGLHRRRKARGGVRADLNP